METLDQQAVKFLKLISRLMMLLGRRLKEQQYRRSSINKHSSVSSDIPADSKVLRIEEPSTRCDSKMQILPADGCPSKKADCVQLQLEW
ncbi:hypothetical protein Taro_020607 [Colocasia esculenta]|uniref:Uncharacterized protein n=1 Tax=Colocasia esculenta TaxID=4460 RepID=A0A843UWR7_COLES|nr:hypothetical protein [Colocasia esculenta]